MAKLRKVKRKQKYQYNKDRKKVKKSQEKYRSKNLNIKCKVVMDHWDRNKAIKENLSQMGLAHDPNERVLLSIKQSLMSKMKGQPVSTSCRSTDNGGKLQHVAQQLEEEAKAATDSFHGKESSFRFDRDQVRFITHLMDKHVDDFAAMSKDPKNVWQETPKQIKRKVLKFCSIPQHFMPYMKERGLVEEEEEGCDLQEAS